jgi:16S rRNA (cytidine1402-2'-O)-methyltransferase
VLVRLTHFIAENPKSARALLKAAGYGRPLQDAAMETLDEHTPASALDALLEPLENGIDCALVSEAGCPAVADPGTMLVRRAHAAGIRVVPLVGPSALLLTIMGAGLNGQRFTFHGYLPVEREARLKALRDLEDQSAARATAQFFIEAPYRNAALLDSILESCRGDTLLCLATDLTLPDETIRTLPVAQWKRARPDLTRRPTVFGLYREKPQKR